MGKPNAYASVWTLPDHGALIVVSNLSDEDRRAQLLLDVANFAASVEPRVWDALGQETLKVEQGKLTLSVPAWRYRVLRVK